jgi:hypothetical protein
LVIAGVGDLVQVARVRRGLVEWLTPAAPRAAPLVPAPEAWIGQVDAPELYERDDELDADDVVVISRAQSRAAVVTFACAPTFDEGVRGLFAKIGSFPVLVGRAAR